MPDELVKKEDDAEANTVVVANTEVKNHAIDVYSKYIDHITGAPNTWKVNALPPSQAAVAASIGKISNKKKE